MNCKLIIPDLNSVLESVKSEYSNTVKWLEEAIYIDYDEDMYKVKDKYLKLLHIILNDLEVWERNLFIGSHFAGLQGEELASLFNISKQSVYNYMAKINKKIKTKMKEYD